MHPLKEVYGRLLRRYGRQGWWPLASMAGKPRFDELGYHRGDYSYPKTEAQRFEIMVGAILTQNTSWRNVEKAIENLREKRILDPKGILRSEGKVLEECLKPAGYFRLKAKRLRSFVEFLEERGGVAALLDMSMDELRGLLLYVNGVGEETADSILLYALGKPSFVVDAYTRRILSRVGLVERGAAYEEIKGFFESNLSADAKLYNEYHALLVAHAKAFCRKMPVIKGCPLEGICEKKF